MYNDSVCFFLFCFVGYLAIESSFFWQTIRCVISTVTVLNIVGLGQDTSIIEAIYSDQQQEEEFQHTNNNIIVVVVVVGLCRNKIPQRKPHHVVLRYSWLTTTTHTTIFLLIIRQNISVHPKISAYISSDGLQQCCMAVLEIMQFYFIFKKKNQNK